MSHLSKSIVLSDKQQKFDANFELKQLGYIADGEPTDAQIHLQDLIDNEIFRFLGTMRGIYFHAADQEHEDMEWDIEKISEIREKVESVLSLPDIY